MTHPRQMDAPIQLPSATVVIAAYTTERWTDLVEAVESVQAQRTRPIQTIVVVDHNPSLLELARDAFPEAEVLENRGDRGLSGARNSGVSVARGEVVVFLDDDAVAEPDWLERLLAPYDDPTVLGVGGDIAPIWLSAKPRWFPDEFAWVVGCSYRGLPQTKAPVRNLIGANMSLRRDVFADAGMFYASMGRVGRIPMGCEETELCIRASRARPGGTFVYEPRARVRHKVPGSRARWSYFASRCYSEGLSKAIVAGLAGTETALASERAYTFRTLPLGVLRGVAESLVRGDPSGLARSAAITLGLAATVTGYLVGSARQILARRARGTSTSVGGTKADGSTEPAAKDASIRLDEEPLTRASSS